MSLDTSKLEKVKTRGSQILAQCPACFEADHDHKGEHLWISADGRFGCVLHPGEAGKDHRRRIFQLVGDNSSRNSFKIIDFEVEKADESQSPRIQFSNVLGHLGHLFETYACKAKTNDVRSISDAKECQQAVPAVPILTSSVDVLYYSGALGLKFYFQSSVFQFEDGTSYAPQEIQCLKGLGAETMRQIHLAKKIMRGTILPILDEIKRSATK